MPAPQLYLSIEHGEFSTRVAPTLEWFERVIAAKGGRVFAVGLNANGDPTLTPVTVRRTEETRVLDKYSLELNGKEIGKLEMQRPTAPESPEASKQMHLRAV